MVLGNGRWIREHQGIKDIKALSPISQPVDGTLGSTPFHQLDPSLPFYPLLPSSLNCKKSALHDCVRKYIFNLSIYCVNTYRQDRCKI